MRTDDLDFDLPSRLIAARPAEPRESARLMVVRRDDPAAPAEHRHIADLPDLLGADDLLVFNRSRVLPARLVGRMEASGGRVEGLWLEDVEPAAAGETRLCWRVLLRTKRPGIGKRVVLEHARAEADVAFELIRPGTDDDEPGSWVVAVEYDHGQPHGQTTTQKILEAVGHTPLPPYITKARKDAGIDVDDAVDRADYQTVFADGETKSWCTDGPVSTGSVSTGSVAAPTAGLHFTPALLSRLRARGVRQAEVTLHVGVGTFRPIETGRVEDHPMHAERCSMDAGAIEAVFGQQRTRVVAVGSTSTRTIESFSARPTQPGQISTDLLIAPGYRWQRVNGLLTNFHLPRSTLLAMVAAFLDGHGDGHGHGLERLRSLYAEAIEHEYRFFSYGDAMLIV